MNFSPRNVGRSLAVALTLSLLAVAHPAADGENVRTRHVLLISIDGMHAVDFENCARAGTCPNLMALAQHGVTYRRTSTSKPSDSAPGLMALVTGGTPRTH